MKIWFTEIGEPLPIEKDVRLHRYGQLTRALARLGHEVTWFTSSFSHFKKDHLVPEDTEVVVDGVRLKILRGLGYQRNVSLQRIKHQAHFAERFYQAAKAEKVKPDIIVSPIPTLEVATAATKYGREENVPVVTDIRDEWPEEFVDLAPKPLRWAARIALTGAFNKVRYVCGNVDGIMGVSRSFMEYGVKYSGRPVGANDAVIPIGYDAKPVDSAKLEEARKWWKAQGVDPNAFVMCFFGTIGRFFDLTTVIEAVRKLRGEMKIQAVLCGHGSSLDQFKEQAKDLPEVIFPGWVDSPKIAALMEVSKVGLAPYVKGARMGLPNKPFEYFSGSLPVVSSLVGEMQTILKDERCGISYAADSVDELCKAIREIHGNPAGGKAMGERARKLLVDQYSIDVIAKKLDRHLDAVRQHHA